MPKARESLVRGTGGTLLHKIFKGGGAATLFSALFREKEDLSQETLPTGVVRIVIGVLLPFAYYLHTPWSNQFLGHENGKQLQVTTIKQILPQT